MMLSACDGVDEFDSYGIDAGRMAYVVTAFQVPVGWSEMSYFYGNCKWTITPNDLSTNSFELGSSIVDRSFSPNVLEPGTL